MGSPMLTDPDKQLQVLHFILCYERVSACENQVYREVKEGQLSGDFYTF